MPPAPASLRAIPPLAPYPPPAKSFAMIEAVVGPMFVAVFLARLVGVRTSIH